MMGLYTCEINLLLAVRTLFKNEVLNMNKFTHTVLCET